MISGRIAETFYTTHQKFTALCKHFYDRFIPFNTPRPVKQYRGSTLILKIKLLTRSKFCTSTLIGMQNKETRKRKSLFNCRTNFSLDNINVNKIVKRTISNYQYVVDLSNP